ncbi:MAG: CpaF family protein, partial [Anaerolineae bacterium]
MSLLKRIERERQGAGKKQPAQKEMQVRRQPASPTRDAYLDLKTRIQKKLIAELDPAMDVTQQDEMRHTIEEMYNTILAEEHIVLSRTERQRLFEQIVAEILGLGPLEPLLADPLVTEVMVNGAKNVYVERNGKITRVNVTFESDEHVMRIIERIVAPLGRRIDESSPY